MILQDWTASLLCSFDKPGVLEGFVYSVAALRFFFK